MCDSNSLCAWIDVVSAYLNGGDGVIWCLRRDGRSEGNWNLVINYIPMCYRFVYKCMYCIICLFVFAGAVLRSHLDRLPAADLQGGVRHGLLQPVGALQEVPLHQHSLPCVHLTLTPYLHHYTLETLQLTLQVTSTLQADIIILLDIDVNLQNRSRQVKWCDTDYYTNCSLNLRRNQRRELFLTETVYLIMTCSYCGALTDQCF